MNELLERLMKEANIDNIQAQKAIETIAGFVKEKFPMLGGAVDQIFSAGSKSEDQFFFAIHNINTKAPSKKGLCIYKQTIEKTMSNANSEKISSPLR